jgi:hypothetical protein
MIKSKDLFMKRILYSFILLLLSSSLVAQTFEWRLGTVNYSSIDPDNAGPATGQVMFTLQIHTTGATVNNITQIATGYAYQSANAMVPTSPGCVISTSTPPNIVMSSAFSAAGFTYTSVLQCNTINPVIITGGQTFDRRANGTIDNGSITIGPAWVDVFTVTLWTLGNTAPQGGYAIINSSEGGLPGEYTTYSVTDANIIQYPANSLTYTTPIPLGSGILPVMLTRFDAQCLPNKTTSITWTTASEISNNYFEVEKSLNGTDWKVAGKVNALGNSVNSRNYQLTDPQGGAAQYRLKQVDKDGKVTYSGTVRSTCDSRNVYVSLYPVPARDLLTLVVGSEKTIKTNLQIFDSKGRMIKSMPVSINKGQNSIQLRVESLAAGEYILKGTSLELEISQRFTILR